MLEKLREYNKKLLEDLFLGKIDIYTYKKNISKATYDFVFKSQEFKDILKEKLNNSNVEKEIILSFAFKESKINPFAIGDIETTETYEDSFLHPKLRYSWGMFQIYAPIHGYIKEGDKIIKATSGAWVDIDRIRIPDIGYQIQVFCDMYNNLKNRIKNYSYLKSERYIKRAYEERIITNKEEEEKFIIALRYNGYGESAYQYAKDWLDIYKKKLYLSRIKI
jgi:hypothetical protein